MSTLQCDESMRMDPPGLGCLCAAGGRRMRPLQPHRRDVHAGEVWRWSQATWSLQAMHILLCGLTCAPRSMDPGWAFALSHVSWHEAS